MGVIQPNTEILAILRLYLEKRDTLTLDERAIYMSAMRQFSKPVIQLQGADDFDRQIMQGAVSLSA